MSTDLVLSSAIAFAMSQICLSIVLFGRYKRKLVIQEWLFLALLITVLAYLLQPLLINHWAAPYRKFIENFLPGVFWLLCSSLFYDRFKIRAWNLCLVGITVAIPLTGGLLTKAGVPIPRMIYQYIPQSLEFVLLALALLAVVRHWKDDLVEARRDLRLWFCAMSGTCIIGMIALREIFLVGSQWFAVWQYLPVGLSCLVTNFLLVQYRPGLLNSNNQNALTASSAARSDYMAVTEPADDAQPQAAEEVEVPPEIVAQLDELMTQQHTYREMGLTIGQLADRLELPEYRLRKIINAGLGYRNFNDYLNGFRIKEAGERLGDPKQSGEAVLNIALDTGFRSLSSFNKAFREAFGQTPTAYRQQHISQQK